MTKRKKMLVIIIALCLMCGLFTACAVAEETDHESVDIHEEVIQKVKPLVFLEKYEIKTNGRLFYQLIFYDPETLIMYSYVEWIDGGGFVEMHEPDGSPRLYKE